MLASWAQIWVALMSLAITSLEVKLSVVPGWKCSGQMMADCFDVSDGTENDGKDTMLSASG